jgi:hypothetical protein
MNTDVLDEAQFMSGIEHLLQRMPAMRKAFQISYNNGKYLQPGYLTEINICATLAKMMDLNYDENVNESNLRHQYSKNGTYLKEYGGCGASDIQLITPDGVMIIEVKEPLSLGGDYDLGITEDGKLFPRIARGRVFPAAAQKILDQFNANDSIINHLGHNIKLSDVNYLKEIVNDYLIDKTIDYIATYSDNNELIYFPVTELDNHVNYNGSEIRTAGKNHIKVYTPKLFRAAIESIGCVIDGNIVAIPKHSCEYRRARGSNGVISGIKINSIFFFKMQDVIREDDEFYYADISKGQQVKQGIGVHLNLK